MYLSDICQIFVLVILFASVGGLHHERVTTVVVIGGVIVIGGSTNWDNCPPHNR